MSSSPGPFRAAVEVVAPAKLTVSLHVDGVRPDGYHTLVAEMVALDLADRLLIEPGGSGLTIEGDARGTELVPTGAGNLVERALRASGRRAGIRLVKSIPVGGGLGGGSSDAAAVLRWARCTDLEVAARLGADVPFCLVGGRALVRGIGEKVEPLDYQERWFTLLVPPFGVDTAAVYREWDRETRRRGSPLVTPPNDLTQPALAVEPRLAVWRDALAEASGRTVALAGSGSTWFVEGHPHDLGLTGASLVVGHQRGALIGVRTVPADWSGTAGDPPGAPVSPITAFD